jgi:hypothetical protein
VVFWDCEQIMVGVQGEKQSVGQEAVEEPRSPTPSLVRAPRSSLSVPPQCEQCNKPRMPEGFTNVNSCG